MLSTLEKAKALREFNALRLGLLGGELKTLEKVKSLKRFNELRLLLGGEKPQQIAKSEPLAQPEPSTLLQDIINGTVSVVDTPSITDELEAIAESADPDLFEDAIVAATRQIIIANNYTVLD
jgi:hypothetical protein